MKDVQVKLQKRKLSYVLYISVAIVVKVLPVFNVMAVQKSFCRGVKDADSVRVKGNKGFCDYCLKLTLLVEENKDTDSDEEKIDFNDRETYETLYKEYWWIINEKEKLNDLRSAKARLKSENDYDSDNRDVGDEYEDSDSEDNEEIKAYDSGKKSKSS